MFLSALCFSQAAPSESMEQLAKTACDGTWAQNSPERAKMHDALEKIRPGIPKGYKIHYVAVDSPTAITAFTHRNISPRESVVCMPIGYIDFEKSEGEIEFTLAHETGHAVDEACYQNYATHKNECERRADDIGFAILQKAGINPDVAIALFKKKHQPDRIANFKLWKKMHPRPA